MLAAEDDRVHENSTGDQVNRSHDSGWEHHVRPDDIEPPAEAIEVSHDVFVTGRGPDATSW